MKLRIEPHRPSIRPIDVRTQRWGLMTTVDPIVYPGLQSVLSRKVALTDVTTRGCTSDSPLDTDLVLFVKQDCMTRTKSFLTAARDREGDVRPW